MKKGSAMAIVPAIVLATMSVAWLPAFVAAQQNPLPPQLANPPRADTTQPPPVRITLDPQELKAYPLRVGLSMTAQVDEHDTSGPVVSAQVRNVPQPTQASAGDDPEVQARIDRIVTLNAGRDGGQSIARAATAPMQ